MAKRAVIADQIWYGEGVLAQLGRWLLVPASVVYAAGVRARGICYDAGIFRSHVPALPVLSVGNLSVGGTGKTPVAAWIAKRLQSMGASPAIVLRGYGGDEEAVHTRLNPHISVIVSADRCVGVASAAARGADVAVLDDAFQHRRVRRVADVVLVSADAWKAPARLLPAGPFREPLRALSRASIIVVSRKAAAIGAAESVRAATSRAAPGVPTAVIALQPRSLVRADGAREEALGALEGERVRAIAAIGHPGAFARQLTARGADVTLARFADHHAYTAAEAEQLARDLPPRTWPVCTLKDLVKLAPLWPREAPPLWYVSQDVIVEQGEDALDALLTAVLRARHKEP